MRVKVIINPTGGYPTAGSGYSGTKQPGLPGYYKLNQYRITGNILRFDEDFGFGTATVGAMYEQASTHRSKLDIDLQTRQWDYREKSTKNQPVGISCAALGYGVELTLIEFGNQTHLRPSANSYNRYLRQDLGLPEPPPLRPGQAE